MTVCHEQLQAADRPGLDLYRRHDLTPPAGWPLTASDDVLLGSGDRARWSSQGWWW
ncbi:hypothetical protein [Streptomyces sp. 1222.5]|uniref:hypothetical protein n=1 Tax=Streptomyces sp. 1222.5 TaxID=1881026 RepID=UPI003D70C02D